MINTAPVDYYETVKSMGTILEVKNVVKTYPGVIALNNVSLDIQQGEIHALIGENGAGKSTIIKTITGAIAPDDGEITISGKSYKSLTPQISRAEGIEAVYQEFNLAGSLTVAENIFIGQKLGKGPIFNLETLFAKAKEVLSMYDVDINPAEKVRDLTIARMQLVEIAKAVARNAKLLILDEPTAPLTDNEVSTLFSIIKKLNADGVTIIYISHRLEEIFELTDRVTVMRDGQTVGTDHTKNLNKEKLIEMMVGRTLQEAFPQRNINYGAELLELKNVSGNGVDDISFKLREGEIIGLAGLVGAGRTELARIIFGADKKESGEIFVRGEKVDIDSPAIAIKHGIGFLTEDRKAQGVLLSVSVKWNTTISVLRRISGALGFINSAKEKRITNDLTNSLSIKTPSIEQLVKNLSGGNQQKVALAKWMASDSKILIFDEPTRGIDVGAKHEIYLLINALAEKGVGIIIISSEMEEILGVSDRLIVLHEGKIAGRLEKNEFSQVNVLKLASGELDKDKEAV
jgi:ribose transport system ATP-binding protein